jgi:hypothetical protein
MKKFFTFALHVFLCSFILFSQNFTVFASTPQTAWTTESPLEAPVSTTYGNWSNAITTDGDGYIDAVWLQIEPTSNDESLIDLGTGFIVFAQSGNEGVNWSGLALTSTTPNTGLPKIASFGSHIYVVWYAQDTASQNIQIFFMHGVRNGTEIQWSAAQVISDTPTGGDAVFPSVAAYGDQVHVAWTDTRNNGISVVYYTGSQNNGTTWSTPVNISPIDGFNHWTPSIAVYSNYVHTAWTDTRFGANDCSTDLADCHEVLYYRQSTNFGQTWQPEIELTCNAEIYTYAPSLFVEESTIHMAYFQGVPSPQGTMNLYYLKGTNNGSNLVSCSGTQGTLPAINVQYPAGDNVLSAWRPDIAVYSGVVYMVWWGELTNNFESGQAKVYYTSSSDGVNWAAATSLTPQNQGTTYRSFAPNISLAPDGSMVYTIWEDHRGDANAQDPNYRIYFRSGSL